MLEPGGQYTIATGLWLGVSNTHLTSGGGSPSFLIAHPNLQAPMLQTADAISGYTLSNVVFDGDRLNRNTATICNGPDRTGAYNLRLRGSSFLLDNIQSNGTLCGTAAEVDGSGFTIRNSRFAWNGFSEGEHWTAEPWSDGLTLLRCDGGSVYNNLLEENSDVDLIVGGGSSCQIFSNTIRHNARYGFAGFMAGWFPNGGGNHPGSSYSGNVVSSGNNLLAIGLMVGGHPWNSRVDTANPRVVNSQSTGAIVNLVVDGATSGEVSGNSVSGAQGNNGVGSCAVSANYTVNSGDVGAVVQPGVDPPCVP